MDFANHPCFNAEARHTTARVHLPVAPKCNVQCNFCNRKYDCVNESRPGVTSSVLEPDAAVDYLSSVLDRIPNVAVVGIAGPGDPFANPEETLKTMELVGSKYPDKLLCLATNGLGLPEYADRVAALNVSHVTITLNAVDPEIGAKIYAWIRVGNKPYRGVEGAKILLERQLLAIKLLKERGVTVKINTVVIPGINQDHVPEIARVAGALGADVQNCIPLMHVEGTAFEGIPAPETGALQAMRFEAGKSLKQMSHCARCRADAAGLLGERNQEEIAALLAEAGRVKPTEGRPRLAVATMEGLFVNRHLGEAPTLWIYEAEGEGITGKPVLVEQRATPIPGGGDARWEALADSLSDCFAVLVSGAGPSPERILKEKGIRVIAVEGLISDTAHELLAGREIPKVLMRRAGSCGSGSSCGGTGQGCA